MFSLEELFSVKGKVVVVTGGGTGLGKAIAWGFAENGAKVYITGRRQEVLESAVKEIKADKGGEVIAIQGDVATKEGCVKIAEAVKAKESVVHTLINCAGVMKPWRTPAHPNDTEALEKQLISVEDEDFDYQNQININGVYFMTAALVPLLKKADDPNVVVIASIAGLAIQRALGSITYGTSKANSSSLIGSWQAKFLSERKSGIADSSPAIHLGQLLAGRLSPFKIRVNTICPGIFPSEMTGAKQTYEQTGMDPGAQKGALRSPLGRAGRPEEIVGPILMLSTRGGGYVDGAVLTVDGGRTLAAGTNDGIRLPAEQYTYV